jgi:hydroxypyruvate isomerase
MLNFSANLSLLFTEVELIKRFETAKNNGFSAVEIQFPYELPAQIIRQALDEHQLELVLFNVDADDLLQGGEGLAAVPEKQAQFKQAVEQAVAYAKILKPKAINILAGRSLDSTKKTLYLETFKNNLRYALSAFSPLAIKTVFEAINSYDMPKFIVDNSLQMLEIQREINHSDLLIQYDIYHMQRMGENCAEIITCHANKIGHIQFADVPGRGQPETGNIDFKAIFSAIESSNYQNWVGAEYNPIGTTEESLRWYKTKMWSTKHVLYSDSI